MVPSRDDPPTGDGEQPHQTDHAALLHETTNALTVVLGWLERARQAGTSAADAAAALERASHTALATRNVLRCAIGARLTDDPPELAAELVRRTAEDLAMEADRHGVSLTVTVADDELSGWVRHPHAVWQILTNLLLNAICATPQGRVRLIAEAASDRTEAVRLAVHDDGPGIPAEHRQRIFDEGFSERAGGAGIGLAHARKLAARHGGTLVLVDADRGARFELCWPLHDAAGAAADRRQAPPAAPTSPAAAPPVLEGRRVLLLEDDPAVAELLELSLTTQGATLITAQTAGELLATLREQPIDTLLIDLSPLEESVESLAAQARALRPEVAVIIVSGSPDPPPGAFGWVRKPFEPSELVRVVAAARPSSD